MFPDASKCVLSALALVAAVAYVTARPKEFGVAEVANKTMCPIKVEIDDDAERIPRRIKFLKCAGRPHKMCLEPHGTHGCCKHHHHGYRSECVEIYDFVQVTYKDPKQHRTIKVPVGCNCLIEEVTKATEVS